MENETENPLVCQKCGIGIGLFSSKAEIQIHKIKIHQDNNLQCFECGKFFDNIISLRKHLRVTHVDLDLQCDACEKKFKTKSGFTKHKRSHKTLKKELEIKNDPDVEQQKCYICYDTFDKYGLEHHLMLHETNEIDEKVKCDICEEFYASEDSLRAHISLSHKVENKYSCDLCNKTFLLENFYFKHLKAHQDIKDSKCPKCGKSFSERSVMLRHDREVHQKLRPLQCEICNKRCKSLNFLRRHLRFVHDKDENTFKCNQCDKAYKEKCLLDIHIRSVHDGEVYGKCDICNMEFYTLGRQH